MRHRSPPNGSRTPSSSSPAAAHASPRPVQEAPAAGEEPGWSPESAARLGHHLEDIPVSAPKRFDAATASSGTSLPFRRHMEQAFGQDLSPVRAYLGRQREAESLGAAAVTDGESILFRDSRPDPRVV